MQPIKNSEDIQFKKSFFKFFAIFSISLMLGLVGRYIIYVQPLDQIISDKISQNENYRIDVQGVQIQLRKGFFPAFAISAKKVDIVDNYCLSRTLIAEDVFVSMNLMSLLQNVLVPKNIYVSRLNLITPKKCNEENSKGEEGPLKPAPPHLLTNEGSVSLWPEKLFAFFKEGKESIIAPLFDIEYFKITLLRKEKIEFSVEGEFSLRNTEKDLVAKIYPSRIEFREKALPVSKGAVLLTLSEDLFTAQYKTFLREGKIVLEGAVKNDKNFTTKLTSQLTKIPISTFSRYLLRETQLKYLWVNCKANLEAAWAGVRDEEFSLADCHLSGPYGTARVLSSQATLKSVELIEVEFDKMDLDQIIEDKRSAYFSGIFSQYGIFSGVLKHEEGKFKLKALLENAYFRFSRNNLRELQKVSSMPFEVSSSGGGWALTVSGVKIDDGDLKGKVSITVDKTLQSGKAEVALHKVRLSPKVYKLMLQSKVNDFAVFADIHLNQGRLSSWSGALTASEITGENFLFSEVKVEAQQKSGESPLIKIVSGKGELKKESEIHSLLKQTTLGEDWFKEKVSFKEFGVKLSIEKKDQWVWSRGYVSFSNGWQMSSEGALATVGEVGAWLQWDVPQERVILWQYQGSRKDGKWKPEKGWMKSWLKANRDYLSKNPRVAFVADSQGQIAEDVKGIGQKLLEKAKSVLPSEDKSKNKGT